MKIYRPHEANKKQTYRMSFFLINFLLFLFLPISGVYEAYGQNEFIAYNDLSWSAGQANTNIALYTTGQSGALMDYSSGTSTAVTLTIAGGFVDAGTLTQGSNADSGTDAYNVFNGIVDSLGVISYSATDITFTFSGLDPGLIYEFVLFGNRNNPAYTDRMTTTTISDVDKFLNSSTAGADFSGPNDYSVTINNGYNTVNGYVARFTYIRPGADGDMVITVLSADGHFYANALMLKATQEPVENVSPAATNDSATTSEGIPVDIDVVANDADPDGTIAPVTVTVTTPPANGTAVANGDGTVTYTPDTGFTRTDTFTYTVEDNKGATSNEATVTVTVGSVQEIIVIIDNRDAATSWVGTWSVSSGTGSYGVDSVFSRKDTSVTPTFSWHFTPSQSGDYEVSMWWTYRDTRSTSVPVDIEYSGGTARVFINQKLNGSTWNVLGTYAFVAGVSYKVTVTAQPIPSTSSTTCADAVRFYKPGNTSPSDQFTIIMLPDTQYYSLNYPQIFSSQTQWIANNTSTRNIVFVSHVGDVVNNWDSMTEWGRANTSMSLLDSTVPYAIAPGNHDEPTTIYNQYFPFIRYENKPWYGGHYSGNNDNSFQLFSGGNMDFLIIHLDFCPAPEVITWADSVLQTYANYKAIITTHGFIDNTGNRSVHSCPDTQYIWDDLVVTNPNVYFVLCGHVYGEYHRMDIINGHEVHQFLADYQYDPNGGDGWLRIMRFVPADNKVYVETYSPWLNQYETDSDSYFAIDFQMN